MCKPIWQDEDLKLINSKKKITVGFLQTKQYKLVGKTKNCYTHHKLGRLVQARNIISLHWNKQYMWEKLATFKKKSLPN